jgi:hypothetical protein
MAFHKREPSKDITSNESRHATPLPTYYSQQLPRWTSKSLFDDKKAFDISAEPIDPSYSHFTAPAPRFDDIPLPPRPQRQRLPKKAILIPWILAVTFFFTTLWFTSLALGVRLFMIFQPVPTSPAVQEIHVVIDGDMFRGTRPAYTSFGEITTSATPSTMQTASTPASTNDAIIVPTTAVIPNADPLEFAGDSELTTETPVLKDIKTSPTGFITVTRVV